MVYTADHSSSSGKTRKRSSRRTFRAGDLLTDLVSTKDDDLKRFRRRWPQFNERVYTFNKRRGLTDANLVYPDEKLLKLRDELRFLWGHLVTQIEGLDIPVHHRRSTRRLKWIKDTRDDSPLEPVPLIVCKAWLAHPRLAIDWKSQKIEPDPSCLEAVLAYACVEHSDRLRYCQNPECREPYFWAERKDQQFCSKDCGSYGQKESKRNWWRRNRVKPAS